MSLKRKYDEDDGSIKIDAQISNTTSTQAIFQSSPVLDRASTFIGFFSTDHEPNQLQEYQAAKSASHKIAAWRRPSKQKSLTMASKTSSKVIYDVGYDDDGEKYAGKKLEKLLIELNVQGTVVVARWYGGVMLGPVRFDHILNVARDAISKWQNSHNSVIKKPKLETSPPISLAEEHALRQRLINQLKDRDNSIAVLRGLLADRKASVEVASTSTKFPSSQSPQSSADIGPDYGNFPLSKLRVLEKARDSTISWILKQIDVTEKADSEAIKTQAESGPL